MSQNVTRYVHPTACLPALTDALQAVGRPGGATAGDWCSVAVALGRCRLFGVEPGDGLDGTLTVPQARTAAGELIRELDDCTHRARQLGETWDRTNNPDQALNLVCSILADRMDAWAALVALDEAFEAGAADGANVTSLSDDLNGAVDALDRFDSALEGQLPLLSLAAGTGLLKNWRAWLAGDFAAENPWWLDGRLEAAAEKVDAACTRTSPSPRQLAALRRQLGLTRLPAVRPATQRAAAATDARTEPAPGDTLCWESPDGLYRAELLLPTFSDDNQEKLERLVSFTARADDRPAMALDGQPVRLGTNERTIRQGQFRITLAELRQAGDLLFLVGDPAEVWFSSATDTTEAP